jgi:ElaB/YqjD/DUF883 family membrane-anchored ribosome-binding protein
MDTILLWPDQPVLSLLLLWLVSAVALWAAREPMLQLFERLGKNLEEALEAAGRWCKASADELRKRSRAALLAAGGLELQGKLEKEFQRIESGFSERLGHYSGLHRRLDDLLQRLEADYQASGHSPPEVPGWAAAVESIAGIPSTDDPNVHKILDGVHRSLDEAQRKALDTYRKDTAERHKILDRMRSLWKDARGFLERMSESVTRALETATRVNGYVDDYSRIRNDDRAAARALSYSATKLFAISLLVLGVALGGAFVNFQLIALPMSELVPAGARLGGVPVATISALVIVLMEVAVGVFVMDLLGFTELFPKLAGVPASRRRLLLGVALGGLFLLAAVESSLAVLREMIVEADAALKLALAGENATVAAASESRIPVIGQAVLGFVLPWIVAMVAIPLEMLLDSSRHVLVYLAAHLASGAGSLAFVASRVARTLANVLPSVYDVYVSVPLRIERALASARAEGKPERRRPKAKLELREETLS